MEGVISMDENKIVPTPEDEAEKEVETEVPAQENETEETDSVLIIEDDKLTPEVIDDELFEDEELEMEDAPKKKKKMRLGAKIAIGILVAIVLFIVASFIYVYIASQPPKVDFDETAMTVGGTEISAAEFFMYGTSVQGSSVDEIKQNAIDRVISINTVYAKAQKEGFALPESEKKQLAEQYASIESSAQAAGVSVDDFVSERIAKGFTYDMYKNIIEKDLYVSSYLSAKENSYKDEYKGDAGLKKLEEAYNKTKTENDLADFSYWYFVADEGAEAKAKSVADAVKGGQTFADALKAVDESITAVTITKETKAELEASFNSDVAAWLYKTNDKNEYANGTGAVEVFKDDSFVYVVCVNNAPSKNTVCPVSANYIKIAISTDTSVKTEEINRIEAKKTADKILAEFLATDKSAEKLTEIATKYSKENKKVTSSTFAGVTNDGSLDAALESWLFDDARKEKDVTAELIEAEDAYYIVYYESKAENAVWYDATLTTIVSEKLSALNESALTEGKKNFTTEADAIGDVMAYINYLLSASSSYGY